ncbi:uncharacterized protein ACNS7B_012745 isoform 2-T5 [Menidia menidia]
MYTKSVQPGISLCQQVKHIEGKGRGVFAIKGFKKGEYVVEYHGDLLDLSQAKMREAEYAEDPQTGCYMYYFQYQSKTYWFQHRRRLRQRAAGQNGQSFLQSRQEAALCSPEEVSQQEEESVPAEGRQLRRRRASESDRQEGEGPVPEEAGGHGVQEAPPPAVKSQRTAARKSVKYVETSSDRSSEDEPPAEGKRRRSSGGPREQKSSPAKRAASSRPDSSSEEDEVPLAALVKKKPVKRNTKRSPRGRASGQRRGLCEQSSEDEQRPEPRAARTTHPS